MTEELSAKQRDLVVLVSSYPTRHIKGLIDASKQRLELPIKRQDFFKLWHALAGCQITSEQCAVYWLLLHKNETFTESALSAAIEELL